MSATVAFGVALPAGYRDREVLAFQRRDPEAIAEVVTEGHIRKGCVIDGMPVVLDIAWQGTAAQCQALVDGQLGPTGPAQLQHAVQNMLALRIDPAAFEAFAQDDPRLGPVIQKQTGLRIPQTATTFEALTWAIMGQQINVAFAATLRRSLIVLSGRRHSSGLWCYPDAADVAGVSVEALMQRQFSRAKAETLVRVAQLAANGKLPLIDWQDQLPAEAGALLLAIKGIGPWTVNYTLLRGFGLADCSLHGDAAIQSALTRLDGTLPKVDAPQAQRILERYTPHRSMAAAHLWASLHLTA
ncbi:MAG: DNA-3-methyladenine glycosylase 2 family protein [Candidatus Sericytochromatia bacterium]|nr:DNA-3-methyladenine glycosylase 2 family protein [Candidatus Sericytochromatia bacterium]